MAKNKIKLYCVLFAFACACSAFANPVRDKVEQVYTAEIGVREKTGNNEFQFLMVRLKVPCFFRKSAIAVNFNSLWFD